MFQLFEPVEIFGQFTYYFCLVIKKPLITLQKLMALILITICNSYFYLILTLNYFTFLDY